MNTMLIPETLDGVDNPPNKYVVAPPARCRHCDCSNGYVY